MLFLKRFKIKRLSKKIKALQYNRVHNPASDEAIKKEITLYHALAALYRSLYGKKKYPFAREMTLECYRAATTIEDSDSQYILGEFFLKEAKFREALENEGIFASSGNEKRMKALYEEALAYLTAAEQLGHVKAKRLHGLCYINAWGVPADKKRGFDLVMSSIEQENSWDKVPQIFSEIGLNKPEFFSALTQFRNKN